MNYHNYREYTLLQNNIPLCKQLEWALNCEYLIVWGGVAWLHCCLELLRQWVHANDIVLVEKAICWWGMSGKSGGFLTPDSELWLRSLEKRYGESVAKKIWEFGAAGQASMVHNIHTQHMDCDLRDQDSLLLGLWKSGIQMCIEEHEARKEYGYDTELILDTNHLRNHNSWWCYTAWDKYNDCFGINAFQYCQWVKHYLWQQGVRVFEFTEITDLKNTHAIANCWSIAFKHCFACPGKVTNSLSKSKAKLLFGVMNFITVSEPLEKYQIQAMMPGGECMCWDTKLVFSYYRAIDGNRIILGWWNPISSFLPRDIQYDAAIKSAIYDFKKTFPSLKWVQFSDYRSWRIQVTKDLMPIIDTCNTYCNHTRVLGCAGLPRAAACWEFAVKKYFKKHDKALEPIFSINRKWLIQRKPSNSVLKSIIFWISNAWSMFWQKGY